MEGFQVKISHDNKKTTIGHLVTQDPITNTVILAQFEEKGEVHNFHLIPGSSIEKIEKLDDSEYRDPKVFEKFLDFGGDVEDSEEEMRKRATKVVTYLRSHHIDVVEKADGIYEISGIVKFGKPYKRSNFYCDIPLVLQRILKLIDQIE